MPESIVITLVFVIGFFVESIFGFGGLIISFSILGFFIDIKEIIPVAIYVGIIASISVLITDHKSISYKLLFKEIAPLALIGTLIGAFSLAYIKSDLLLKIFALFLIVISGRALFFEGLKIKGAVKCPLLFSGGLMQGLYGTGGPITILAMRDSFVGKSSLRSTMALYFIIFNLVRIIEFKFTGAISLSEIFKMWWLAFPIFTAIYIGYYFHLKISERFFRRAINLLLLTIGIIYMI